MSLALKIKFVNKAVSFMKMIKQITMAYHHDNFNKRNAK